MFNQNLSCGASGLMEEKNLAAIVFLSFEWYEHQKLCFLGKIVCYVSNLSNKEIVVSTQISAFLEVACITPNPQLYPECQRKHDFLDKGGHILREKKYLCKICCDSPSFTLPHSLFKFLAAHRFA